MKLTAALLFSALISSKARFSTERKFSCSCSLFRMLCRNLRGNRGFLNEFFHELKADVDSCHAGAVHVREIRYLDRKQVCFQASLACPTLIFEIFDASIVLTR